MITSMIRTTRLFVVLGVLGGLQALAVEAAVQPERYSTETKKRLGSSRYELALKRYRNEGAQPVILLHGICSNELIWDSPIEDYSFAKYLHSQGFDVWLGNYRGAGSEGFRSESPKGQFKWTIEDYAIDDLPALIERVHQETKATPFIVAHSLSAWVVEGYLAGLRMTSKGVVPDALESLKRSRDIKGVITVAGMFNPRWEFRLLELTKNPILSEEDFYHSNYELEAMARSLPIYPLVREMNSIEFRWLRYATEPPVFEIPYVGPLLRWLYRFYLNDRIVETPILSMFYYTKNIRDDVVWAHGAYGVESTSVRLTEQFGNAIRDGEPLPFYQGKKPKTSYRYMEARRTFKIPTLFVAGTRDRLASSIQVQEDGFAKYGSSDKTYIESEAGHLDIITGHNAEVNVWQPVAQWMKKRLD